MGIEVANAGQIGGDHYRSEYQHWDFVENAELGYFEGCATKYISRWRKKGGVQDLQKALHYLVKLSELRIGRDIDAETVLYEANRFCETNQIDLKEARIIKQISIWSSSPMLEKAKLMLAEYIEEVRPSAS